MTRNPYDEACRYGAKIEPFAFLKWLVQSELTAHLYTGWLDTRTVPFPGDPDRVCDTVAGLVEQANPEIRWALVVEFETKPPSTMFGRVLEYLGRMWLELRPPGQPKGRFQVVAAVVSLTGASRTSRDMALPNTSLRTCLQVAERNLAQESAAATLADIACGRTGRCLLPWIPLMQGGAEAAIIEQWKQLALEEPDARRRADYAGLALVFAELTGCRPQWKKALEGWNVEQSQQVLEWQAEARIKGEAVGEAKGQARSVLRLLERRFGLKVPPEVANAIGAIKDLAQLDSLFDAALAANSLDEFRRGAKL